MKILFITLLLCLFVQTKAQHEELKWIKNYGEERDENLMSVSATADGGFIVAGFTSSKNFLALSHHGGMEGLLIKCDSTGKVEWRKLLGGPADDGIVTVKQTRDKGYILSGWHGGAGGDVTGPFKGTCDAWVVKLDSLAHVQWDRSFGGKDRDVAYSVTETCGGDFLVGHVHEDFYIESYLYRLGPTGTTKWSKQCGQYFSYNLKAIELSDKSILMCVVEGGKGYHIIRTDSSGKEIWKKRLGPITCTYVYGFDVDAHDNFALCVRYSKYDTVLKKALPCNFLAVKGDKNGNIIFERQFATRYEQEPSTVLIRKNGGLAMAGFTEGKPDSLLKGKQDMLVIVCDSLGNNSEYHYIGGSWDETATGIAETKNGDLLVCGQSISWDNDMPGTNSLYDGIVTKIGKKIIPPPEPPAPETSDEDSTVVLIPELPRAIYPVPAHNEITIGGMLPGEMISVYNQSGEPIVSNLTAEKFLTLNVSAWPRGTYFICRRIGEEIEVSKILVR